MQPTFTLRVDNGAAFAINQLDNRREIKNLIIPNRTQLNLKKKIITF